MIKTTGFKREPNSNIAKPVYQAPSGTLWTALDEGNYNRALKKIDDTLVLKIQKDQNDLSDSPARSVRLWNLVNQHVAANAQLEYHTDGSVLGWVCPFIEGVASSDAEIGLALIEIFNRTGRIVTDATAMNNFITTPAGQTICVDVGMALEFAPRSSPSTLRRQVSAISLSTWLEVREKFPKFFDEHHKNYPITIETIKALIFIQENKPHMICVDFLINKPLLRSSFSHGYDAQRRKKRPVFALSLLDDQVQEQLEERQHHAASIASNPQNVGFFNPAPGTQAGQTPPLQKSNQPHRP